jgi:hypothetical protein
MSLALPSGRIVVQPAHAQQPVEPAQAGAVQADPRRAAPFADPGSTQTRRTGTSMRSMNAAECGP